MLRLHVGSTAKVLELKGGTNKFGPWQSAKLDSEDGKTRYTFLIEPPVPNLREGDTVRVDDIIFQYYFSRKEQKQKEDLRLTVSIAEAHGMVRTDELGVGNNDQDFFDPNLGELPF